MMLTPPFSATPLQTLLSKPLVSPVKVFHHGVYYFGALSPFEVFGATCLTTFRLLFNSFTEAVY